MRSEGYCSCPVFLYVCMCVCMYVCMYVCVCVCVSTHTCCLTHCNHKIEIPTDSAQYRDRLKFLPIFLKCFVQKLWRNMPTSSSSGVLALFSHEISFYAGLKPIATFSLHRQRACGRQRTILSHRLVKRHRYTDHE